MENFDELFNEFFNKKDKEKEFDPNDLNDLEALSDTLANELIHELETVPDEISYFEEDGLYYERKIWFMEHGMIMKTISSKKPLESISSLQERLEYVIKIEDYETASKLRDQIKKTKRANNKKALGENKNK
jgi:excinuclease UvrABC helicase subunit UvrB|tara:strand:- start:2646 stop:3038 length:393 start_codon:yes stop_codon:yes gene_type:complete